MSQDITFGHFLTIQEPRSRSLSSSSSDYERPVQVSPSGQLHDCVEAVFKTNYSRMDMATFAALYRGKSFSEICQYKSGLCGAAILVETSAACLWDNSSLTATGSHLQRLGYDTCALSDPPLSDVLRSLVCFVNDAHSGRISGPLIIAFSCIGDEESVKFQGDDCLHIEKFFAILQCIPETIPIAILFDCISSRGVRKIMENPFQDSERDYMLYHVKRSVRSPTSLFNHLRVQLPTSTTSLKSIIQSCDDCLVDKSTTFMSTNLFSCINLRADLRSLPGVPICGYGVCDVYKVLNRECNRPSDIIIPGITSQDRYALTPIDSVSVDQEHILRHRLGSQMRLLEDYSSCLREADPDALIVHASAFYDNDLKARFRQPGDPATQFHQFIQEKNLWVSVTDLDRLKDVAEAVDSREGMEVVEKMKSLLVELISERTIPTCQSVAYPHRLPHKSLFVFVVDDDFRQLSFSEALFYDLYYRVRTTINVDGYIAFVTLQTALEKGLKVRPPS